MTKVKPEIINWIFKNIPKKDLTSDVKRELKELPYIDANLNTLQILSTKIDIPLGYFFLSSPPKEELLDLEFIRKAEKPLPRTIINHLYNMGLFQDYIKMTREEPLSIFESCVGKSIDESVEQIFQDLDLYPNWKQDCKSPDDAFEYYRSKLEKFGVIVIRSKYLQNDISKKIDYDICRSFTLLDSLAPLIYINDYYSNSIRSTLSYLVYESVSIWIGKDNPLQKEIYMKIRGEIRDVYSGNFKSMQYKADKTSRIVKRYGVNTILTIDDLVQTREITYVDAYRLFNLYGNHYKKLIRSASWYHGEFLKEYNKTVHVFNSTKNKNNNDG